MASKEKLLDNAQKFIAKGQNAKAIGEYQQLVDAFPKDFRFRQKLAELLTKERRNEEAQPHYEAVAKNFTETGFYLKAIAIYKQMQKVEPNRADLYLRLAELNEKHGLTGNALTEYRNLIAFYEKNKQTKDAVPVLQKMIALDPDNLGVRGKLIETLCANYDEDAAREQFRALVTQLAGKGEHGKVVKLYEKFLDLSPDTVDERLPLAQALLATDQANKALQLLKGLLKQTPEHDGLLGLLIDCHLAVGNHEDARLTSQHLLKNHPDDLALRERYVRICLAAGDYQRAFASLEEWCTAFSQAGKMSLVRELFAAVQVGLPDQPQVQAALAALADSVAAPALPSDASRSEAGLATVTSVPPVDVVAEPPPPAEAKAPTKTPPSVPPPVPTAPSLPKAGGLELELDLDLDLTPPAAVAPVEAPPVAAVESPPVAPVEPVSVPTLVVDVLPSNVPEPAGELELELDLGGLDEPVEAPVEEAETPALPQPPAMDEMELEIEFDDAAVEAQGSALAVASQGEGSTAPELDLELELEFETETLPEELPLPDLGDYDLIVEVEEETPLAATSVEPEAICEAETEFAPEMPAVADVEPEELAEVAGFAGGEEPAAAEEVLEVLDEIEELAELEPVEYIEEILEVEDVVDGEEIVEAEPLEEITEISEIEAVEPLEELDVIEELVAVESHEPVLTAASSPALLREGLEEAEFYLRQGLFDDAERVAGDLQGDFADHPEVITKLAEIAAHRQAASRAEEPAAVANLFADIKDDELFGGAEFAEEAAAIDEFSLEAPANDEDEDIQSHFDLGIAYKEMGLLDDAVAEFDRASRDTSRRLDCLTLKGQCQIEMGQAPAAEITYRQALDLPLLSEEGRIVLCYELGLLYEILGRRQEALDNYQLVADMDLFFRDVTDKLKLLRQELGIDDQAIEAVSEGGGGRDRISFV